VKKPVDSSVGAIDHQRNPLLLKHLLPADIARLMRDKPQLIIPVGTTEQHGPHLPLGCDTTIVERLSDDLSREFGVLRAPTLEYGVNAATMKPFPGAASISGKTLHRVMNDLIGSWEAGGFEQFVIITAHSQEPHQEALCTIHTRHATVRTVDIFGVPLAGLSADADIPCHGGELDTSLLLYVDADLVDLERAIDYSPSNDVIRRYNRGSSAAIPKDCPGSLGHPGLAATEKGERLYHYIYERIATRVFGRGTENKQPQIDPTGTKCDDGAPPAA
jgi:creatinine amidohydrolase